MTLEWPEGEEGTVKVKQVVARDVAKIDRDISCFREQNKSKVVEIKKKKSLTNQ